MEDKPSLESMFNGQNHRIKGIRGWKDVEILGCNNIGRLIQISQELILKFMTEQMDKDELKLIRKAIDYLECLKEQSVSKPLLPRLRNESINSGDNIYVYLADTKGIIAKEDWVKGLVIDKEKSFKSQWVDGSANSGYFWLLTVKTQKEIFSGVNTIKFSTSEPRVLHEWELFYLKNNLGTDPQFIDIFSVNANRDWFPIWCLENDIPVTSPMDMKSWLFNGSFLK
jgi:hypothetical protein